MPPKKNVTKTAVVPKIPKEKVPKARIKKEKPKLKIPTVLKVKIPLGGPKCSPVKENNVVSTVSTAMSPPSSVKPVTKRMLMIDRINEVAKAQLVKDCPVTTELGIPEKKKRGRKKKIQPDPGPEKPAAEAQPAIDVPVNTEVEVVEKKKRVWNKKIQPEPVPMPESAENAEETPKKNNKMSPKVKPSSKGVIKKPKAAAEKTPKKKPKSTKPVLTRKTNKKADVKPVKKKSTRGKTSSGEDSSMTSSILSQSLIGKEIQKPMKPVKTGKDNAESRVTPLTNASEWKDISSSSATTDIVRKDKKPPVTKNIVKRKYVRRKTIIDEDSTITSPSILSQGLLDKTHDKAFQKPSKMPSDTINNNTDSGRTSVTSASEWSWTKDISGSSTTTCITVSSTDFVRIDGKLPIVKLNYCNAMMPVADNSALLKKDQHSLSEDSSSSSSSSSSDSFSTKTTVEKSLNLSTSSVSPVKCTPRSSVSHRSENNAKEPSTLEKLALQLKMFRLPPDRDWDDKLKESFPQIETYDTAAFKVMTDEHSLVLECIHLSQILSNKCAITKDVINKDPVETVQKVTDFAKPSASAGASRGSHEPRRRDSMAFDPNDDDDALSLFAESITFDSSRISSASQAPDPSHEEYIPRPIRDTWAPVERSYRPSKITKDATINTKKPVCEKQNADSTSLHKELDKIDVSNVRKSAAVENEVPQKNDGTAREQNQQLTIWTFQPQFGMRSPTLRGVCFFHLISTCRKIRCNFPHRHVEKGVFSERLSELSEEQFIQEYLLIAKFPTLRIHYTSCFVMECQRRELPIILVEMVIDFIRKSKPFSKADMAAKVDAIESALLYLNTVNLAVCEDRLKYKFNDGKYLCELFMEAIANTQNFWRFKPVFLALASFMVRERRTFSLQVATHILERVCIFKFEQPLALVLISIIELTDGKIFDNAMMGTFERQLMSFSKELHERFLRAKGKGAAAKPPPSPAGSSLALSQEAEPHSSLVLSDPENRYTSPDTTNLDNLNKPVMEPVITRTINSAKVRQNPPGVQNPVRFHRPQQNWCHRSIYNEFLRFAPPPRLGGAQLRPRGPLKRPLARQVQYGPRLSKYPRRSPDYFGN